MAIFKADRQSYACKAGATKERFYLNTRHAVGNNKDVYGCVPTAEDGRISIPYLNDRITSTTAGMDTTPPAPE